MEVLNVIYQARKGKGSEFYHRLQKDGITTATRLEEGLITYEFYQSFDEPDKILLLEIWKDETTRMKHKTTEHYKHLTELYQIYVDSYAVNDYRKENN